MARMSGAEWRPLPHASSARIGRYDLVVIHTMVGSLAGTDAYFRGITSGVNSHFGTGGGGEIYQWVDTAVQSGANLAANGRSITVENADMGPGFSPWNTNDGAAVPAFTPQQIEANAQICAWAHTTHGVPLEPADTSLPGARGIGFHRLGINPWRLPAGELWSSATGKVCPSPRRIAQVPQIIARARQIVAGTPTGPSSGAAVTILGDDMPTVMQAGTRPPVLAVGGLFVELLSKAEQVNALRAYNQGQPVDGDGVPQPVWLEDRTLTDLIAQSQRAVRGGS